MKLRNKKTGEIYVFMGTYIHDDRVFFRLKDERGIFKREINSLAELNEEWEDYKEPKEYWYIDTTEGTVVEHTQEMFEITDEERKEIGNYFETEEEAEKAVEKLKAVKRLKDKGFDIFKCAVVGNFFCLDIYISGNRYEELKDDLKTVFGDEE